MGVEIDTETLVWVCIGGPLILLAGVVSYIVIASTIATARQNNPAWRRRQAERSVLNSHLAYNRQHPPTQFVMRFPYWCHTCQALVRYDEFYYEIRDSDWGDYVAIIHTVCDMGKLSSDHREPRKLFHLLTDPNPAFGQLSAEQQRQMEEAFLLAYSELRGGKLAPELRAQFEPLLMRPNHPDLLGFLSQSEFQL